MEITNNKYNTMPEQVQENKDNIKVLAEYIKEAYNATTTLETMSTTIDASMVRDWVAGTTKGFILDQAGKLFKIVAVSDNTIFIQWWASLPQGATGATGARGEAGAKGDKGDAGVGFNNTTDINLVVGEPLSVTYDTEDGITITSQGGIEADGQTFTPTVENNVPLIAGNGLTIDATEDGKHVDVHLSAETQNTLARSLKTPMSTPSATEIVAVDNTNAQTMLSIGDGLIVENGTLKSTGGPKKYQHNIQLTWSTTGGSVNYNNCQVSIINTDADAYTTIQQVRTALTNYLSGNRPSIIANGYVYDSTYSTMLMIVGITNLSGSGLLFTTIRIVQAEDKTISYSTANTSFSSVSWSSFSSDNVIEI